MQTARSTNPVSRLDRVTALAFCTAGLANAGPIEDHFLTQTQKSDATKPVCAKAASIGLRKTDSDVAGFARIRGVLPYLKNPSQRWLCVLTLLCGVLLSLIAGCHRGFYRRQADAEARRLIVQKHGPRWDSASGDIEINPLSRMFDPFSADHPPIPPDDPSAHQFLSEVDNKPGYPHWHANGDINQVANPVWRSLLPVNENDEVVVSLADAYRLALTHSPDLQEQRETLYLSALEVSIQRFGLTHNCSPDSTRSSHRPGHFKAQLANHHRLSQVLWASTGMDFQHLGWASPERTLSSGWPTRFCGSSPATTHNRPTR